MVRPPRIRVGGMEFVYALPQEVSCVKYPRKRACAHMKDDHLKKVNVKISQKSNIYQPELVAID